MRLTLALLPLAVAGCIPADLVPAGLLPGAAAVPAGQVRVVQAQATPASLVLRMSNGDRCTAARPEGAAGNWSGVTGECPYGLPVTVVYRQGGDPARFRIEAPAGVRLGPDGTPGPRAEVFVTDVDGVRRLFIAPLGDRVRFEPVPAG